MMAVFLHGVADTYRVWDDVRSNLRDLRTTALKLPGFGAPIPIGFQANKQSYVDWIIDQLEVMNSPVDLVGHDWGCIFALRIAYLRPDLVRTVAAGSGPISSNYEWHPLAKIWQTPTEGERFMETLTAEALSGILQNLGIEPQIARSTAGLVDPLMKTCILQLYRSAAHLGEEWEPELRNVKAPVKMFWGTKDAECPVRFAYEMAASMPDADVIEMDCGHWVPLAKPDELATALRKHWQNARSVQRSVDL